MKRIALGIASVAAIAALSGCVVAPIEPVPVARGHYHGAPSAPPRAYRDRDGDGVPNRYDRRPDNPYRY